MCSARRCWVNIMDERKVNDDYRYSGKMCRLAFIGASIKADTLIRATIRRSLLVLCSGRWTLSPVEWMEHFQLLLSLGSSSKSLRTCRRGNEGCEVNAGENAFLYICTATTKLTPFVCWFLRMKPLCANSSSVNWWTIHESHVISNKAKCPEDLGEKKHEYICVKGERIAKVIKQNNIIICMSCVPFSAAHCF